MNLRTITIGIPLETQISFDTEAKIQKFLDEAKTEFGKREVDIRTFRINLSLITEDANKEINKQRIIGIISQISELCDRLDIRWFNVPFDLTKADERNLESFTELGLEIIKRFPKTFINLIVAGDNEVNCNAIKKASKFIKDVSRLDNTGYNNFRVGVSCNVNPNTPFFPFTYSSKELGFSIGLELPQAFTRVIKALDTNNLLLIREELIKKLLPEIKEIEEISNIISKSDLIFRGIDLSLAPYPEQDSSVTTLLELLGLEQQGSNGTLFITSYLTDILKTLIKQSNIKNTGFNGVMFSLLEDEIMGKRNNQDTFSIDSLISYSAVCGCGLDMVPLPGDIFEEELAAIIMDVAALSTTLEKPLGVRVLPIPMKHENDFTLFNMEFLVNTRIKKVKNLGFFNKHLEKKSFSFLTKRDK